MRNLIVAVCSFFYTTHHSFTFEHILRHRACPCPRHTVPPILKFATPSVLGALLSMTLEPPPETYFLSPNTMAHPLATTLPPTGHSTSPFGSLKLMYISSSISIASASGGRSCQWHSWGSIYLASVCVIMVIARSTIDVCTILLAPFRSGVKGRIVFQCKMSHVTLHHCKQVNGYTP